VFKRVKQNRRGPRQRIEPGDDGISEDMAGLADAFVRGSAEEGHHLNFAVGNASRLDALVDLFRGTEPHADVVHSMVLSMGAYVGELIVRNGGGSWTYQQEWGAPAVQLASGSLCFPLNKVAKRISIGPEHSIAQFVEVALSGAVPPEARPV
jgi:hypothetical protein